MHPKYLARPRSASPLFLGLILIWATAANSQQMVELTDMSGATVKLSTLQASLALGEGDLAARHVFYSVLRHGATETSSWDIYTPVRALPIRLDNGVIEFVSMDKISEYQGADRKANLTLVGGARLEGSPLAECVFEGEGAIGKVSLPAREVRTLKFDSGASRKDSAAQPSQMNSLDAKQDETWTGKHQLRAILTPVSGGEVRLQSVFFLEERTENGCDENYIPCRPRPAYTFWQASGGIPVKYGAIKVELDILKMQALLLTSQATSAGAPYTFDITLRSGEKIRATLDLSRGHKPIGILGSTENGFAHVPVGKLKAITFVDGN